MEISDYTSQLIQEYNKKMEQIIKHKLSQIEVLAFNQNEVELAEIIHNLDVNDIEKFKSELEVNGYTIEIEKHETITTYEKVDDIFKATTKIGDVKLKVKKLIIEV
jgi:type II secretory pathway component PulL